MAAVEPAATVRSEPRLQAVGDHVAARRRPGETAVIAAHGPAVRIVDARETWLLVVGGKAVLRVPKMDLAHGRAGADGRVALRPMLLPVPLEMKIDGVHL